jgi:hypothetical protein
LVRAIFKNIKMRVRQASWKRRLTAGTVPDRQDHDSFEMFI